MNELEKIIEKLQNLSHDKKKKIMWVVVPVTMVLVLWIWLSLGGFKANETIAINSNENEQEISKFEIFKNGLKVTFDEVKKIFENTKNEFMQKEEPAAIQNTPTKELSPEIFSPEIIELEASTTTSTTTTNK